MDIVIAILVSTVISLGIALYFRGLNKNEDPLEKINKYANKRQEDLLKLYKEIQGKFNAIMSEFTAQQTQANAAVKLLKQQNEEFNGKMQTFSQSIEAVKSIKAQIDNYAKVLDELNQMTENVEEKWKRLVEEL